MSLANLFHFLCAQHVSDINISIIRSLRLCCLITTTVVLFSVRCVLEIWLRMRLGGLRVAGWSLGFGWYPDAGFSLQHGNHPNAAATKSPAHNEPRTKQPLWYSE